MPAIEAWLIGGPVDGRTTPIEVDEDGSLPQAILLLQAGAYLGGRDHPSPPIQRYFRCDDSWKPPNHHRNHTSLGGKPPISRVNNAAGHYN
ncbi:hypothetical protein M8C17_18195 [Micromonospora sp. RHAY321]|uniref:hypothetical protein n=1 Tax=Micromonospora sp. RHAY321 TaxID=2944807 RepID=UPI00207C57C9|nr:hypothetical protein [Micromonospora sp. RHAY321]MCO1597090.1 hypothetical protein [Micromonospora sp. RHAY321]